MARLEGKVALITGGASGIGAETGRRMAAEGARVVLTDRNADLGAAVAEEIGNEASFFPHDVTTEEDWKRVVAEAEKTLGHLDVVMNCAGISVPKPIDEASLEHWRETMAVNADGVFLGCKYGVEALRRTGGGSIINVSSTLGIRGGSVFAAYCASKGAVRMLTKSVALRCAEERWNIRCNSIHPGATETPIIEPYIRAAPTREEGLAPFARLQPMGRVGQPYEIAALAIFLASDESSFITGAEIPVDGGFCA
jgi:3(or 17)beta-hydroxysteroid dehydrogenase